MYNIIIFIMYIILLLALSLFLFYFLQVTTSTLKNNSRQIYMHFKIKLLLKLLFSQMTILPAAIVQQGINFQKFKRVPLKREIFWAIATIYYRNRYIFSASLS